MNHYTTTIHIRCPFQPVWDYYEVELQSGKMVQCEVFEECCDQVRGMTTTQEEAAEFIREFIRLKIPGLIFTATVTGRHGANCKTVIRR